MATPEIVYYHDGRHPHIYRYEPPMYPEEYQACVDELATTSVEAVMFGLAEGRTMLHDTSSWARASTANTSTPTSATTNTKGM